MKNSPIIFIGPCGGGGIPKDGASGKNYHFLKYIKEKRDYIKVVDTANWRKRPWVLVRLLLLICFQRKANYILATDNLSSYRVIKIFSFFPKHRYLVYWMIGGSMPSWIKEGRVEKKPFKAVDWFVVEGRKMMRTLDECGFTGKSLYVPNFKNIGKLPDKTIHNYNPVRFVFLSRIIPEKGCDLILEAAKILNKNYKGFFSVDFFGPIEDAYCDKFSNEIKETEGVSYKGFLDLRDSSNYEILEKYDVMLFPTFWHGEGFPGIIVDAYIAGLPILASDWSLNSEIIDEGDTGYIIQANNVSALANKMKEFIQNPQFIKSMSTNCRNKAQLYNIENVITDELLTSLGL